MVLKNKFNLEELIFVVRVREQELSLELENLSVERVVVLDSKQFDKDHLWYNKFVEIVMELDKWLEILVMPAEEKVLSINKLKKLLIFRKEWITVSI